MFELSSFIWAGIIAFTTVLTYVILDGFDLQASVFPVANG
jgi:cytochrome bd-type quinol oxidase subunit 2